MLIMVNETFSSWLNKEMGKTGVHAAELARRSGLSRAAISRLLSEANSPSADTCIAIAEGLNVPAEDALRAAGKLPRKPETTPAVEQTAHLVAQLDSVDQEEILEIARLKARRKAERTRVEQLLARRKFLPPEQVAEEIRQLLVDFGIVR